MKKLLSILLAFSMLLSMTAGLDLSAYASDYEVLEIKANETKTAEILNAGDYCYFSFIPESDGVYTFTSISNEDTYGYLYDSDMNEIATDDDAGEGTNFLISYDFEAGKEYIFGCRYYNSGNTGSFDVSLKENLIQSIGFTPIKPYEIIENTNGSWEYDEDDNKYYHYDINYREGDILTVFNKDGSSVDYTYNWYNNRFNSEDGDYLDWNYLKIKYNQLNEHWTVGGENYFTIEYMSAETQVPVTIVESPVASVSFEPIKSYEIIEKSNGWEDEDGWYYYAPKLNEGDAVIVEYKDGTAKRYVSEYDGDSWFINEEDNDDEICVDSNGFNFNGLGETTFRVSISTDEFQKSFEIPVTIVENPIDHIEFSPVEPYEIIENTNGSWDYDEDDNEFYYYDTPYYQEGDVLTIFNKDGSSVDYIYNWDDECFYSEDGDYIYRDYLYESTNQLFEHWTVGGENYFTIKYMNFEVQVPVSIVENPIDYIEFTPVEPYEIIESTNGYWDYDEDDNEYYYYSTPYYQDGDVLTVFNKDGSSVDYIYNWDDERFYSEDGDYLYWNYLNKRDNQRNDHWTLGSDNYFTIEYMGAETQVPVTIVESPVESIQLVDVFPVYINTNGYWVINDDEDIDEDWDDYLASYSSLSSEDRASFVYRNAPPFTYIVNYKDGTSSELLNSKQNKEGYLSSRVNDGILYVDYINVSTQYDLRMIETNEFSYFVQDGKAIITDYLGCDEIVTIPTEIQGYEVVGVESLCDDWSSCITELIIPNGINIVSNELFDNLRSLTRLELGDSVSSLEFEALKKLNRLEEIIVSNDNPYYKDIDGVLYSKDGKKLVYYPLGKGSSYEIEASANDFSIIYDKCYDSFSFNINNADYRTVNGIIYSSDMKKLIRCDSSVEGEVTVPNTVTQLGENAFKNCDAITSIKMSSNVTDIVYAAFADCSALTSVDLPTNLKSIGEYAFGGCAQLTSINLGNSVESIGEFAFSDCSSLTNFTVPNSVTEIGEYVFADCFSLESLVFGTGVKVIPNVFGYYYDNEAAISSITIPEEVEQVDFKLHNTAYYNNPDNWENGLLYVGTHLVACDERQIDDGKVVVKEGTTDIGHVFDGCSNIIEVQLPNSVKYIAESAFAWCEDLKNVNIPTSLKTIESGTFRGTNVERIEIPNSVTKIAYRAFYDNSSLQEVVVPNQLISIDGTAFNLTKWLDLQPNGYVYLGKSLYSYKGTAPETVNVAAGTLSISSYALQNQTTLKNINLPEGLSEIGLGAFADCNITEIDIPESVEKIEPFAIGYFNLDEFISSEFCAGGNIDKAVRKARYYRIEDLVITGAEDSEAERYAEENDFEFDATSVHVHEFVKNSEVPATCTSRGYSTYVCTHCGYTYFGNYIAELGHDFSVFVETVEPTIVEEGYTVYKCSRCDEIEFRDFTDVIESTATVIISNETVKPNNEVVVSITLSESIPIKSIMLYDFEYDEEILELVEARCMCEDVAIENWDPSSGEAVMSFRENTDANGLVLELVFRAKDVDNCETNISCSVVASYAKAGSPDIRFPVSVVDGSVIINSGDVNGDGVLNTLDVIYLLKHTILPDRYPIECNADYNGDGVVTSDDAIYLLSHIMFPDRYPLH